jgi:hypothetical protein
MLQVSDNAIRPSSSVLHMVAFRPFPCQGCEQNLEIRDKKRKEKKRIRLIAR